MLYNPMSKKLMNRPGTRSFACTRCFLLYPLVLCAGVLLKGCASPVGALGGKTKLNIQFVDRVDPVHDASGNVIVPGQYTSFENTSSIPAGVEVKDVVSLKYLWNPDGSGEIGIAKRDTADTTIQAELLNSVIAVQTQALLERLDETLKALVPLLRPTQNAPAVSEQRSAQE